MSIIDSLKEESKEILKEKIVIKKALGTKEFEFHVKRPSMSSREKLRQIVQENPVGMNVDILIEVAFNGNGSKLFEAEDRSALMNSVDPSLIDDVVKQAFDFIYAKEKDDVEKK